jgi:succinate dehydrogenase/fumarate reductase cytochrome b subunit
MRFKPTNSYVAKLFIVHGGKGGLIVFFLCFLHLSNNLVEADWGLSLKEELKFQKRLINLKKSAIKSIQVRFLEAILLIILFK